jgi:hypothetical protein
MTHPLNSTSSRAQRDKRAFLALANEIERNPFWVDSSGEWELPPEENKRQRKVRVRPPDGLRTPTEAACKLGCSIKTLNGYVASGALRYVQIGHGKKRPRKMFADADLDAFIANQTRKDVPCPSIASGARRSGTSNSASTVIAFTAAPKPRPGAKPKK